MLNHPHATACPDLDQNAASESEADDVCSDAPSLQEVRDASSRVKNGREAGPDGIPPELLKCATESISNALHSLIVVVWREGQISAAWRDRIITALYKGMIFKVDCDNYCPITLLSVLGKVFSHVLHQAPATDESGTTTVRLHDLAQYC